MSNFLKVNIEKIVILYGLILLFIIIFGFQYSPVDSLIIPKLTFLSVFLSLIIFLILIYFTFHSDSKDLSIESNLKLNIIDLLLFAFFLWYFFSFIWAPSPYLTISFSFLLFSIWLINFLFVYNIFAVNEEAVFYKTIYFVIAIILLEGIYILLQIHYPLLFKKIIFLIPPGNKHFLAGTIGNPNYVGNLFVFFLSFIICFRKNIYLYIVFIFYAFYIFFLLRSRGALVGGIFALLITNLLYLYLCFLKKQNENKGVIKNLRIIIVFFLIFTFTFLILFSFIGFLYNLSDNNFKNQIFSVISQVDKSAYYRIPLQAMAWLAIQKNPFFGNGGADFEYNSNFYQSIFFGNDLNLRLFPSGGIPLHVHNTFLELFADLGIIGVFLVSFIFITFFYRVLKTLATIPCKYGLILIGASGGVFGFLVHSFVSFPFFLPVNLLLFLLSFELSNFFIKKYFLPSKEGLAIKSIMLGFRRNITYSILLAIFIITLSVLFAISKYYFMNAYFAEADMWRARYIKTLKMHKKSESLRFQKKYFTLLEKGVVMVNYLPDYTSGMRLLDEYIRRKKYEQAFSLALKLEKIYNRPLLSKTLAYLYEFYIKDYKKAITYYLRALKYFRLTPKSDVSDWAHELGVCYYREGKVNEAIYWTKKALEYNPSTLEKKIRALFNLSIYYYDIGSYNKSLEFLQKAKICLREWLSTHRQEDQNIYKFDWYRKMLNSVEDFEQKLQTKIKN